MLKISAQFSSKKGTKLRPFLELSQSKGKSVFDGKYENPFLQKEKFQLAVRRLSSTYAVVVSRGQRLYSWDSAAIGFDLNFSPITKIEWSENVRIDKFQQFNPYPGQIKEIWKWKDEAFIKKRQKLCETVKPFYIEAWQKRGRSEDFIQLLDTTVDSQECKIIYEHYQNEGLDFNSVSEFTDSMSRLVNDHINGVYNNNIRKKKKNNKKNEYKND